MKKKLLLCILILSVLSLITACGDKGENSSSKTGSGEVISKADISFSTSSDGKNIVDNRTSGYKFSYNDKKVKMNNSGSCISFVPSDKKDKKEKNLFLSITETDPDVVMDLGKQIKEANKDSIQIEQIKLGDTKTKAEHLIITNDKKIIHDYYIISSDKKGWYIEIKCPSKYNKKYMTIFKEILDSLEF